MYILLYNVVSIVVMYGHYNSYHDVNLLRNTRYCLHYTQHYYGDGGRKIIAISATQWSRYCLGI